MGQRFAQWLLRCLGWTLVGSKPAVAQCVIIFAPHTSNWDFPIMYLAKIATGVKVNFLGKDSLFRWPFGWFFRALGGIPVVRHEQHNVVDATVRAFADNPRLWLAMAPEGTRSKTEYWRSGFYHIALGAKVPVQLAFLDTRKRELGLGDLVQMSGDKDRDFALLRAFYQDKYGFKPHLASAIRLRS